MPGLTDIQWTMYSSNPLKLKLHATGKLVNACIPCSPGCKNCYAGRITGRWWDKAAGDYPGYGAALLKKGEWVLNERELHAMLTFRAKPKPGQDRARVFIGDMTDIFGEWVPFDLIDRMFAVFALRPDVDWQVLTKRTERMREYLNTHDRAMSVDAAKCDLMSKMPDKGRGVDAYVGEEGSGYFEHGYLANLWLGTSVEDQQRANERIIHLLRCPAAIRFLSCEPLLGPIDLTRCRLKNGGRLHALGGTVVFEEERDGSSGPSINQIIVGGESGPGARRFDLAWADSLRRQCEGAGTKFFMKQLGENAGWTDADGDWHAWKTKDSHGGEPSEWPETFKWAREFPTALEAAR